MTSELLAARAARPTEPLERTDESLLLAYRATGQTELFDRLVRRYEKPLYRYLCRYLNDTALAEDVFQQTFLQVHLKCDQFEEGRSVRPWIYAIATNQAVDAIRRSRRHRHCRLDPPQYDGDQKPALIDGLAGGEPQPWIHLLRRERSNSVRCAVARLSEPLRRVIHLIYFQGLMYQEAADELRLPIGTVKSRVHAAIAKLRVSPLREADFTEMNFAATDSSALAV